MKFTTGGMVVVICFALIAAVPTAPAASCTNASLKGVFGYVGSGLNGSSEPAASIAQVTFDGAGNATGSETGSIDGTIATSSLTGTYQIEKDCTGAISLTNSDDKVEGYNIVFNDSNKGAFLIRTDADHVQSGVAVAQGTATCTNAGVKHTYSMELTGSWISTGQVAMVGQLVLNGKGTISGAATLSLYGTIVNNVSVTGTYSIDSNCTGTMQITPSGESAINLALVIVNADKEMVAVETDTNTIVSGILQE
jgi:hypothetical protein